ncbi:MAG: Ig-like domain-containing protein [Candidatus Dormibacteria bacterium]
MSRRLSASSATIGLLFGAFFAGSVAAATPTLAYQGCNTQSSASATPSSADPNQPVDFTITLRDCNGNGIGGAQVTFSQAAGPAGCTATFTPTHATTDANGQATTVVTLPAGCPCQYTLSATGAGITLTTTVRENGCLPFTSAGSPRTGISSTPPAQVLPWAVLAAGLALLVAAAFSLARRRA